MIILLSSPCLRAPPPAGLFSSPPRSGSRAAAPFSTLPGQQGSRTDPAPCEASGASAPDPSSAWAPPPPPPSRSSISVSPGRIAVPPAGTGWAKRKGPRDRRQAVRRCAAPPGAMGSGNRSRSGCKTTAKSRPLPPPPVAKDLRACESRRAPFARTHLPSGSLPPLPTAILSCLRQLVKSLQSGLLLPATDVAVRNNRL